jgi:hypothetical protein
MSFTKRRQARMANKQVYRDATAALIARGLFKGELVNPKTGKEVCAFGAVGVATNQEINSRRIWDDYLDEYVTHYSFGVDEQAVGEVAPELITAAIELFPNRALRYPGSAEYNKVPAFNDAKSTTIEDVVAVLKRAEELASE